jgi:hypothetical protein
VLVSFVSFFDHMKSFPRRQVTILAFAQFIYFAFSRCGTFEHLEPGVYNATSGDWALGKGDLDLNGCDIFVLLGGFTRSLLVPMIAIHLYIYASGRANMLPQKHRSLYIYTPVWLAALVCTVIVFIADNTHTTYAVLKVILDLLGLLLLTALMYFMVVAYHRLAVLHRAHKVQRWDEQKGISIGMVGISGERADFGFGYDVLDDESMDPASAEVLVADGRAGELAQSLSQGLLQYERKWDEDEPRKDQVNGIVSDLNRCVEAVGNSSEVQAADGKTQAALCAALCAAHALLVELRADEEHSCEDGGRENSEEVASNRSTDVDRAIMVDSIKRAHWGAGGTTAHWGAGGTTAHWGAGGTTAGFSHSASGFSHTVSASSSLANDLQNPLLEDGVHDGYMQHTDSIDRVAPSADDSEENVMIFLTDDIYMRLLAIFTTYFTIQILNTTFHIYIVLLHQGLGGPSAVLRFLRIFLGNSTGLVTFLAFGLEPQLVQLWMKSTASSLQYIGCLPESPAPLRESDFAGGSESDLSIADELDRDAGVAASLHGSDGHDGGRGPSTDSFGNGTVRTMPRARQLNEIATAEGGKTLHRQASDPLRLRHARSQAQRRRTRTSLDDDAVVLVNYKTITATSGSALASEVRSLVKQEAKRQQIQRQHSLKRQDTSSMLYQHSAATPQEKAYDPLSVIGYFGTDLTPRGDRTRARRRASARTLMHQSMQ